MESTCKRRKVTKLHCSFHAIRHNKLGNIKLSEDIVIGDVSSIPAFPKKNCDDIVVRFVNNKSYSTTNNEHGMFYCHQQGAGRSAPGQPVPSTDYRQVGKCALPSCKSQMTGRGGCSLQDFVASSFHYLVLFQLM